MSVSGPVHAQFGVEIECPLLFSSFSPKWYAAASPPPKAPAIAMGRTPAVDLNIMPVRVAAPTELNSSSSPPRNLPINVSRLQYIRAVHKTSKTQSATKENEETCLLIPIVCLSTKPEKQPSLPKHFCWYPFKYTWVNRSTGREVLDVLTGGILLGPLKCRQARAMYPYFQHHALTTLPSTDWLDKLQ